MHGHTRVVALPLSQSSTSYPYAHTFTHSNGIWREPGRISGVSRDVFLSAITKQERNLNTRKLLHRNPLLSPPTILRHGVIVLRDGPTDCNPSYFFEGLRAIPASSPLTRKHQNVCSISVNSMFGFDHQNLPAWSCCTHKFNQGIRGGEMTSTTPKTWWLQISQHLPGLYLSKTCLQTQNCFSPESASQSMVWKHWAGLALRVHLLRGHV